MLSRMLAVCWHFRPSGKDSFVTTKCAFGELDGQEDCGLSCLLSQKRTTSDKGQGPVGEELIREGESRPHSTSLSHWKLGTEINPCLHYAALWSKTEGSRWCCSSRRVINSLKSASTLLLFPKHFPCTESYSWVLMIKFLAGVLKLQS